MRVEGDLQNCNHPRTVRCDSASASTQSVVHAQLASLRRRGRESAKRIGAEEKKPSLLGVYGLPTGCLFRLVSCPHYTAECCIYFSLAALSPSPPTYVGRLVGAALSAAPRPSSRPPSADCRLAVLV